MCIVSCDGGRDNAVKIRIEYHYVQYTVHGEKEQCVHSGE